MESIKDVITTHSRIQHTTKQISESFTATTFQNNMIGFSPSIKNGPFTTSIFSNSIQDNQNNQKCDYYEYFCSQQSSKIQNFQRMISKNKRIIEIFRKICLKKQRYSFQVLKQFILFPDESQSSLMSISKYDPIIFHQEIIHSLTTILQTQRLRNELWAFTNLKIIPKLKAAKQIFEQTQNLFIRKIKINKKASFDLIKQTADKVISIIMPQIMEIKHSFWKQHSEMQTQQFQKKSTHQKNHLTSRIIDEQIRPVIRIKHNQNYDHSDRIKIIRFSSKYYDLPQNSTKFSIQHRDRVRSPIRYTEKPIEYVTKDLKKQKQQVKTSKYNVIHYYERPKHKQNSESHKCEVINHCQCIVRQNHCHPIKSNCCCYQTAHNICTCQKVISYQCCHLTSKDHCCTHFHNNCNSKVSEKPIQMSQTAISLKQIQCNGNAGKKSQQFYSSKMILPQLQSRIEYLKLLRSLADSQNN